MNEPTERDQPLRAAVEGEQVVIRIGIDTLAHAAKHCERFYDHEKHGGPPYLIVGSTRTLAKDVVRALQSEEEDGSGPLTNLFDDAIRAAYDDGSDAFEDYE